MVLNMGSILSTEKWDELTVQERIHLCREQALEAQQLAQQYRRMAAGWDQLATELEQQRTVRSAVRTAIRGRTYN
jgi:hypothetical protein